jgi:hypothetical protein
MLFLQLYSILGLHAQLFFMFMGHYLLLGPNRCTMLGFVVLLIYLNNFKSDLIIRENGVY